MFEAPSEALPAPHPAEIARLDEHFRWMTARLSARVPGQVRGAAKRARERQVEALDAYRRRGRFPRNRTFAGRLVPHFIDDFGTRCAMAMLMEKDARDLVHFVAREHNFAKVRELVAFPEVRQWLERNGLTANEAALIQPSYPTTPAEACVCQPLDPTLLEGTVSDGGASLSVTNTYGPMGMVGPGEIVTLDSGPFTVTDGDVVLARLFSDARIVAPLENGLLKMGGTPCYGGMDYAEAPADLPLAIFLEAASAETFEDCTAILVNQDPAWGEVWMRGTGGGDATTTSTGSGIGFGGAGGQAASAGGQGGTAPAAESDGEVVNQGCGCSLQPTPGLDVGLWVLAAGAGLIAMRRRR